MTWVLTLIGNPAARPLRDDMVASAAGALAEAGAKCEAADWLAPGIACDLAFDGIDAKAAEAAATDRFSGAPLDLAVQVRDGRRKALLVADMDATIVTTESLDDLAEHAGLRDKIAPITARAMAGELDFAEALRARVAMLAGLPAAALEETLAHLELSPGARTLVQTMKAGGAYTALVSGGFTDFTARVRERCGFDEDQANRLVLVDGRLSGRVVEPVLGRDAKLRLLLDLCDRHGLSTSQACSVGDGANDADMLGAAGLGVAYHGKPPARAATRFRVDHGDLTALLYLQGYRQSEFAA